jgi:hypothetical protein
MWSTIAGFLGPLVLGIVTTTVIEAATGKTWGLLLRQRFEKRARKRLRTFGFKGDLIRRGLEALYVIEFVPNGWKPEHIIFKDGKAHNLAATLRLAEPSNLPVPADHLAEAIEAERVRLDDSPDGWWNGETVGVDVIQTGRIGAREYPVLTVTTFPSDHAAATVCSDLWKESFDADLIQLPQNLDRPIPGMIHAVGLNATLVTADNQLILVRRASRAASGRTGWHISVNEGMQDADRNRQEKLDPHEGVVRGVHEELGITIPVDAVNFHTAMFDVRRYQFGLLGHIDLSRTDITAADISVARMHGIAKDKFENSEIVAVPWDYEHVLAKLTEHDWVAHGWMNLLHSAIAEFTPRSEELYRLLGETAHARLKANK